jgi:hypothetical protein
MEGPWKVVYKNELANRNESRGKARVVELYQLENDIAETNNLVGKKPEIAKMLSDKLRSVVARGTSREGPDQSNDTGVVIDVTQKLRWAPALESEG